MLSAGIRLACPADTLLANGHSLGVHKSVIRLAWNYPVLCLRPTARRKILPSLVRGVGGIHEGCVHRIEWRVSATTEQGACPMNSDERLETGGKFGGVVVGGTFDRLHEGHLCLLKTAVGAVAEGGRLLVGIATGPLLATKLLRELIEPYEYRLHAVEEFLHSWARTNDRMVDFTILPITEAAPLFAILDATLQCLVVSEDTEKGAQAFNEARVAAGVSPLTTAGSGRGNNATARSNENELIPQEKAAAWHLPAPLSCQVSTFCRLSRENEERLGDGALITGPYMLGLTGGIAAGKSFVLDLMKQKGVEVLDCDTLAHLSYIPGTPTYHSIVQAFGPTIILPDGSVDRRALSSIVFSDCQKMDMLTAIVWPAVRVLVAEAREAMAEQGVRVCLAEAALLLEAHWQRDMHEVWVVFTPHDTALARLMSRNHLSEEEAEKRINSQMTSMERVARADVVIYNGWSQEETTQQVDKAWELLQKRVVSNESHLGTDQQHPLWVRWAGLMKRLQVDVVIAKKWWHILVTSYEAPNRDGHSLAEIQALYKRFHQNAHFFSEPHIVQLSIFFHDLSYDPCCEGLGEHQARSVLLFKDFTNEARLGRNDEMRVCAMILHTIGVDEEAQEGNVAPFLDEPRSLRHLKLLCRK